MPPVNPNVAIGPRIMPVSYEHICVVIGRTRHRMVHAEIQAAAKNGARLIEVRLDYIARSPDFKRLLADKPCPIVATVRRTADGGKWTGTEDARRALLRQAIVSGFDWVDLETDVADVIPRFGKVKRIVSYHNMREVPADLEKIHEAMCKQDADIVKIAVRATQIGDAIRVLKLMKNPPRPTVALAMGDLGMATRILGARLGAPFTYAAFNKERGIAPGLFSFDELRRIYFYEHINAETKVYGVIGDPVAHSLSPLVHNHAFRHLNMNAVYMPFRVPRGELPPFLNAYEAIPVHGYSVTVPHKEAAVEVATHKDETVQVTHAANTLIRGEDGFWAYNTDYQAVLDTLKVNMKPGPDNAPATLHGKNALVLGAGGIARSVAHALHRVNANVTIANRTEMNAHLLAMEVGCRHVEWDSRNGVPSDLVVNCTTVGMHPNVDDTPIHHSYFKEGMTVFDTVYTPETTLFIKEARGRGAHTITGVDLFVRQAALQFKLFTGQDAPLELIRQTVKRALSPVSLPEPAPADDDKGGD
jgi:3-dehydroquinate dehydratase/shikimate dehydrogenase